MPTVVAHAARRGGDALDLLPLVMRQELACLESRVATCERCFGPERRHPVRLERPAGRPRILVLLERPARAAAARGERLGLTQSDPTMEYLRERLREAGIGSGEVLVGPVLMCRSASRAQEAAIPTSVSLAECAGHVRELIRLSAPLLVLPLGRTALRSLRHVWAENPAARELSFPESVGRTAVVDGIRIHPLYHVTRRARVTRGDEAQGRDWRRVGRLWKEVADEAGAVPLGRRPP